jgi:hypothetical protein
MLPTAAGSRDRIGAAGYIPSWEARQDFNIPAGRAAIPMRAAEKWPDLQRASKLQVDHIVIGLRDLRR